MKICSKCGLTKPGKMFKNGYICVSCEPKQIECRLVKWIKRLIK